MVLQQQQQQQQQQHRYRRGKGNTLFYSMMVFAICWIQLTGNVIVYFLRNGNNSNLDSHRAGRFPLQPKAFESEPKTVTTSNLRSTKNKTNATEKSDSTASSLEVELLELSKRLEQVQKNLEDTTSVNPQDGSVAVAGSSSATQKVFFPFTIRDAQRTVATQIPHGFEVFDFIDLYATNGDQNQTAILQGHGDGTTNKNQKGNDDIDLPNAKARAYRNGKAISVDETLPAECHGYSKRCYRTKFLQVIRYLLSHTNHHKHKSNGEKNQNVEYYYFYMEADNDLCVPLSEVRDIAFEHQRYFVSAGTGASGWIMSHRFLEDFFFFWKSIDENNMQGLTKDEIFEPDAVAAVLLKQRMEWSVTRRYLTSHSILTGKTNDATSIEALFQKVDQAPANSLDGSPQTEKENKKDKVEEAKKKRKQTPEEEGKNAPLMEPSRYLPRCLEPHRGVWKSEINKMDTDIENDFDVYHWGFFDYDLCPESDIFPCEEGQLKELAKRWMNLGRKMS